MSIHADITDFHALSNLSPSDICLYLTKNNWEKVREAAGSIIFDSENQGKVRVWVPMAGGIQEDFILSMGKLLRTLSSYEDRPQLDILEDFDVFSTGDVIRLGSEDPIDRTSSSVLFDDGIKLINRAKAMLLAGASVASSDEIRAFFGSRKPSKAEEYIKTVRLGQTERGSYVVKVISPLPKELEEKGFALPGIPESPPFPRMAVEQTVKSMSALSEVVTEMDKRGKFYIEPFYERISDGVTADLCEAIIGKEDERNDAPISFSVAWSPSFKIQVPEIIPEKIIFPIKQYRYIEEAAKAFRKKEPERVSIVGYVVKLHKEAKDSDGDVTVATTLDGKPRKIKLALHATNYDLATEAHKKWFEIRASGVLERSTLYVETFASLDSTIDLWE